MRYLFILLVFITFSCSSSDDDSSENVIDNMEMNNNDEMNDDNSEDDDETFVVAYQGDFVSVAHPTTGVATVNEEENVLRFTNFNTDNGPLLLVYLATDTSANDFINLGELQGIQGDFDYSLPSNVDFETYNHVIIWCVDFSVNFGYAILQ